LPSAGLLSSGDLLPLHDIPLTSLLDLLGVALLEFPLVGLVSHAGTGSEEGACEGDGVQAGDVSTAPSGLTLGEGLGGSDTLGILTPLHQGLLGSGGETGGTAAKAGLEAAGGATQNGPDVGDGTEGLGPHRAGGASSSSTPHRTLDASDALLG
jgi:hypothetical protein